MTTTDWIIDIALIVIVLRQIREERLSLRFLLIPVAVVGYVASHYLHALPTAGNDLTLAAIGLVGGAALGIAGGLTTRVRAAGGNAYVHAGFTAATIWIGSMTARLAFIIYITHSSGQAWLERFSQAHDITSATAWQDALVILALTEVIGRIGLIVIRGERAKRVEALRTGSPATSLLKF